MNDQKYILKDKKLIPVDLMTWAKWLETAGNERVVKQEELPNGRYVSTVFMGLDQSFCAGEPLLFETMVFPKKGEWGEIDSWRYSTYEQAEAGHRKAVEEWFKK